MITDASLGIALIGGVSHFSRSHPLNSLLESAHANSQEPMVKVSGIL